jgi:hypothetical protein
MTKQRILAVASTSRDFVNRESHGLRRDATGRPAGVGTAAGY